jgi:hypothetical protein
MIAMSPLSPAFHRTILSLGLGMVLLSTPLTSSAQHISPSAIGADALGMADATLASGVGHSALYMNPAGMAQIRVYQLTIAGSHLSADSEWIPSISIVDSNTNDILTAGVGYTVSNADSLPSDGSIAGTSSLRGSSQPSPARGTGDRVSLGILWRVPRRLCRLDQS